MTRTYLVVFEKTKDGWGAFAPDVPGTGGVGGTVEETRRSLREGIGYMLEDYVGRGVPVPEATSTVVDFSEFDPNPAESHYEVEWLTVDIPERSSDTKKAKQHAA